MNIKDMEGNEIPVPIEAILCTSETLIKDNRKMGYFRRIKIFFQKHDFQYSYKDLRGIRDELTPVYICRLCNKELCTDWELHKLPFIYTHGCTR